MAITRETVLHIAKLARLELSPDEIDHMQRDLANIVDYVAVLGELGTDEIPETAQVAVQAAPLRPDEVKPGLENELALAEAPRHADGAFAVPAFMDES